LFQTLKVKLLLKRIATPVLLVAKPLKKGCIAPFIQVTHKKSVPVFIYELDFGSLPLM